MRHAPPRGTLVPLLLAATLLVAGVALAAQPQSGGGTAPGRDSPPPGVAVGWHRLHDATEPPQPPPAPPPAPPPGPPPAPPDASAPPPAPAPAPPPANVGPVPPAPDLDAAAPSPTAPAHPPAPAPEDAAAPPPDDAPVPPLLSPATPRDLFARALDAGLFAGAPAPGAPDAPASSDPAGPPPPGAPPDDITPAALAPLALVDVAVAGATVAAATGSVTLVRSGALRRAARWLLGALPLYSRLARADVLANDTRMRVYEAIERAPGTYARELKRTLGLRNGTLLHHLRILEENAYVHSGLDGRVRRYFVMGAVPSFRGAPAMDERVLDFVATHPSTTNAQIALALHQRPTLVHYHVARLERAGQLMRERVGREVRLSAAAAL